MTLTLLAHLIQHVLHTHAHTCHLEGLITRKNDITNAFRFKLVYSLKSIFRGGRGHAPQWRQRIATTIDFLTVIHSSTGNTLLDVTLVIYNYNEVEGNKVTRSKIETEKDHFNWAPIKVQKCCIRPCMASDSKYLLLRSPDVRIFEWRGTGQVAGAEGYGAWGGSSIPVPNGEGTGVGQYASEKI